MKALIWISSFIVFSILNILLGYATGIKVGSVLFYIIWFYSCKAMCKAWDKHKIEKKAAKAGVSSFESIKAEIPAFVMSHCEDIRGNYDLLKSDLKDYAKSGNITRAQADILLDEYMHSRKKVPVAAQVPPVVVPTKVDSPNGMPPKMDASTSTEGVLYCRICGEKLLKESKFCRKCGTEVVEIPE